MNSDGLQGTSACYRAARQQPSFSCLWKLLGDACVELHVMHRDTCHVTVPRLLIGSDSDEVYDKTQLLALATKYMKFQEDFTTNLQWFSSEEI